MKNRLRFHKSLPKNRRVYWRLKYVEMLNKFHTMRKHMWNEDYKRRIMESVKPRFGAAMGGEIPVRQNQSGVSELDLRAKGGYIPVGIKEKADDVPAMLSKNEFVFTADAVRGAGGGNINKGAQKMYKLMKSLEKKVKKIKVA